jgi:hypothetical protein
VPGCPEQGLGEPLGVIGRRFRLQGGRFPLPNLHRRRAQTPSRSLPLFSRAARSCLRVALSTNASLLPRAAFGRVPPLHDERPPICVPMTITPVAFSPSETPVGRFPFRRTSLGVASARPAYNPPVVTASDAAPHPWRRVVLSHLEHTPDRLHLGPYAPPGDECAGVGSAK